MSPELQGWEVVIKGRAGTEMQRVTDNHPYWVMSLGWTEVADLREGMALLSHDGTIAIVHSSTNTGRIETTYNLEVEGLHSFYVGNSRVLVHNGCVYYLPDDNYVGRTKYNTPAQRPDAKGRKDGRDRTSPNAEVVAQYDGADEKAGRILEQAEIDRRGGVDKLSNRRNEIRKPKK